MSNPSEIQAFEKSLTGFAQSVLNYLAPHLSRSFPVFVKFMENDAATDIAFTNGALIRISPKFFGLSLTTNSIYTRERLFGLIGHELIHFFQPLPQIGALTRKGILVQPVNNLLMDIQGEIWLEQQMPFMTHWLQLLRRETWTQLRQHYQQMYLTAYDNCDLQQLLIATLFFTRFSDPGRPMQSSSWSLFPKPEAYADKFFAHLQALWKLSAASLPDFIQDTARLFPELLPQNSTSSDSGSNENEDNQIGAEGNDSGNTSEPADSEEEEDDFDSESEVDGDDGDNDDDIESDDNDNNTEGGNNSESELDDTISPSNDGDDDGAGEEDEDNESVEANSSSISNMGSSSATVFDSVQSEINREMLDVLEVLVEQLIKLSSTTAQQQQQDVVVLKFDQRLAVKPSPETSKLAEKIQSRFQPSGRGALMINAPVEFDRMAAVRNEPAPFQMQLLDSRNRERALKFFILADDSDSTSGACANMILQVAQAATLALRKAEASVHGAWFGGDVSAVPDFSADIFFQPHRRQFSGTVLYALPELLFKFPDHQFIIITDGAIRWMSIPEPQRQRCAAVCVLRHHPSIDAVTARQVDVLNLEDFPRLLPLIFPRRSGN